jgi:hypothetical protein
VQEIDAGYQARAKKISSLAAWLDVTPAAQFLRVRRRASERTGGSTIRA